MKLMIAAIASLALSSQAIASSDQTTIGPTRNVMQESDLKSVSPTLEKYANGVVLGDLWKRPGLSPRDRSIVTLAILIARNQTHELRVHLDRALANGVKPQEISEIITHLAFYSGWGNAMAAATVAKEVFVTRKIGADQLPPALVKERRLVLE